MTEISRAEWEEILLGFPDAHILQTTQWGELKSHFGWTNTYLWIETERPRGIGGQVLFRQLPFGNTVAYLPKGLAGADVDPVVWNEFLLALDQCCRERKAIFLIIEPDTWQQEGSEWVSGLWPINSDGTRSGPGNRMLPPGLTTGFQSIQPIRTIVVDLSQGESAILAGMKQKTRYNIRLAQKKGVLVRKAPDLEAFHKLLTITGARDGFAVHSLEYYQKAYELFHVREECEVFLAEYNHEALAALMVFRRGKRAWYFYGGSSDENRELMPNYLLQWEAMLWAASNGCESYDLWGVPDADESELEGNFTTRSGGLWGVYRFKRGFGGKLVRSAGPWERVYQPTFYRAYRWWYTRGRHGMKSE